MSEEVDMPKNGAAAWRDLMRIVIASIVSPSPGGGNATNCRRRPDARRGNAPQRRRSARHRKEIRAELGRLDQIVQNEGEVLVTDLGFPWLVYCRSRAQGATERELRGSVPRLTTASEILIRQDRDVP